MKWVTFIFIWNPWKRVWNSRRIWLEGRKHGIGAFTSSIGFKFWTWIEEKMVNKIESGRAKELKPKTGIHTENRLCEEVKVKCASFKRLSKESGRSAGLVGRCRWRYTQHIYYYTEKFLWFDLFGKSYFIHLMFWFTISLPQPAGARRGAEHVYVAGYNPSKPKNTLSEFLCFVIRSSKEMIILHIYIECADVENAEGEPQGTRCVRECKTSKYRFRAKSVLTSNLFKSNLRNEEIASLIKSSHPSHCARSSSKPWFGDGERSAR